MRVTVTTRVELHDEVGKLVASAEAVQQGEAGGNPAFLLVKVDEVAGYAAQRVGAMVKADLDRRQEVKRG